MIVSDHKEFIFCHIPKTGGGSVRETLYPHCGEHIKGSEIVASGSGRMETSAGNVVVGQYLRPHLPMRLGQKILGKYRFKEYFKFAFVRNPWDRFVSFYHFFCQNEEHRRYEEVRKLSFTTFIDNLSGDQQYWTKFLAQKDFVYDEEGNLLVDFVGRFETLQKDLDSVSDKLGIKSLKLPEQHVHKTDHKRYTKYYNNSTRKKIARVAKLDIKTFGYKFGD